MSIVVIAVVASVAGCGGSDTPGASKPSSVVAPSPSRPPVDPEVAFKQYEHAARPFECTPLLNQLIFSSQHGNVGIKDEAREYRDVVATWDAQLAKIVFPEAGQPIVDRMREFNAAELTGLSELAAVDIEDVERVVRLAHDVEAADASTTVEGDRLRAVLGHPENQAGVAADQLDLAYIEFFKDQDPLPAKWKAAIAANDLDAAKAVYAIEKDAAQRYLDRLGPIDWPAGFEDQVDTLHDDIRGIIEFDRHHVDDVSAVAQLDEAPGGINAADAAKDTLWNALVKVYNAVPKC